MKGNVIVIFLDEYRSKQGVDIFGKADLIKTINNPKLKVKVNSPCTLCILCIMYMNHSLIIPICVITKQKTFQP